MSSLFLLFVTLATWQKISKAMVTGTGLGSSLWSFPRKKKKHFGFRTFPETRPPARDKNGTPTSVALATINSSSSCHRHTKQRRRQGLRTENASLFVNHRTRGEEGKPKEKQRRKKRKTFFLSQALTLPHTALVTMVGNKKEEPWLWTKGCPSLSASRLSLVSVPRGRSQQQQER